jgi:hypothetical protein
MPATLPPRTLPDVTDAPSPTDVPAPPPAAPPAPGAEPEPQGEATPWTLRRSLRTASAESWDIVSGEERLGTLTVQFGGDSAEGLLALPQGTDPDAVRGVLAWLTDLLALDASVGPGGGIHWVVSVGQAEDFWRRSPGRRPTGAETDVATARARVEPVLGQMFPNLTTLPDGGYAVDAGSVRVFVNVQLADAAVIVRVFSITNVDVPVDGDLPRFLLGLNHNMPLGRFSLDAERRAVWCDHVLTGEQVDDVTLARVVSAVASTADRYDDEIKARFGGRTFREEGSPDAEAAHLGPGMAGGYL